MLRLNTILIAFLLVGVWLIACGDETPTAPAPSSGGTNHSPAQPTIDTARGAPADGATNRSVASWIYWNCTDPDGDALKFDVFFGTDSSPASVATDQAANNHNPGTLSHSTKYYWKIVAKDPDGKSADSPVWSFTTAAATTETVTAPGSVAGAATRPTGGGGAYSAGTSTSSLGHTVQYQFDWGDGSFSGWLPTGSSSHAWNTAGVYEVKAQARCATHNEIESGWSPPKTVTVSDVTETVSVPGAVTGPAAAETGHGAAYNLAAPSTSSLGHPVEYRYDWGDGNFSTWSANANSAYTWNAAGSYDVKAQARCRDHTAVESGWTAELSVTVTDPTETVSKPTITSAPSSGGAGEDISFYSNYANSSEGHQVEHRYDWGDGSMSDWAPSQAGTHAWTADGTYDVKSQARCATHTTVESAWSDAVTIDITSAEIISTPTILVGTEVTITKDVAQSLSIDASSNFGHPVEYFVEWGDGQTRDWASSSFPSHAWSALGDYNIRVKARCRDHTTIESDWSATTVAHIVESVSRPTVSGPPAGTVNVPVTFTTSGSVSGEGHALEYRLWTSMWYFQGWQQQPWTTIDNLTHTFNGARTWYVRVQARCIEHQTESLPSDFISINVTN